MDPHSSAVDGALEDFSLREASRLYAVELSTLQGLARRGRIDAFKAPGPWGREWRVTRMALEELGYVPRPVPESDGRVDERVAHLEKELAAARRKAAVERSRAEDADRRLGEALMEAGRLRAALEVTEGEANLEVLPAAEMQELRGALFGLRAGLLPRDGV